MFIDIDSVIPSYCQLPSFVPMSPPATTDNPTEMQSSHPRVPTQTCIEPVKEERYFDFQFFTPEQDSLHWREKTDHFWGHILGYEGKGSLLSYLKDLDLATGLSAGMYYDGAGCGVFHVRVKLTKEKGVDSLELIGELLFKYLVMLKWELIDQHKRQMQAYTDSQTDLPENERADKPPRSRITRIWEELRDLGKLRFQFSPLPDAVSSVMGASRNALLYPPEDLLRASCLMYDYDPNLILEFFSFFRLDNMRLVRFHKRATEGVYFYLI